MKTEWKAKEVSVGALNFFFQQEKQTIVAYLLRGLIISLFLPVGFSNVIMIMLGIVWLTEGRFKDKFAEIVATPTVALFWLFFGLFLFSLLYSTDISYGLRALEIRIPILVFPMILFSLNSLPNGFEGRLLHFFARVCVVVCLILFGSGLYRYLSTGDPALLFYENLSSVIEFHPVYLSYYLLLGLIIYIFSSQKRPLDWIASLVLISTIVALSSKLAISLTVLFLLLTLLQKQFRKRNKLYIFILAVFCGVGALLFDYNYERISDLFHDNAEVLRKENFRYDEPFNGLSLRIILAKTALKGISIDDLAFYIGVGAGDAEHYLNSLYQQNGLISAGFTDYNTHNQYVDTFVQIGIIGVLCLLLLFGLNFRQAICRRDLVFFCFLAMIFIGCFTESLLSRNKGVIFFSFFCMLCNVRLRNIAND